MYRPLIYQFVNAQLLYSKIQQQNGSFATPEMLHGAGVIRPQNSHSFNQGPGMIKIQSLDFGSVGNRETEAKRYRMKVLQSQKKPISKMSEDLKQKKKKQEDASSGGHHGGHGHGMEDLSEKATFGQCVFNMANILMGVGMLGLPFIFKRAGWFGGIFVTLSFSLVGKYYLHAEMRLSLFTS